MGNYDKFPRVELPDLADQAWAGWPAVGSEIARRAQKLLVGGQTSAAGRVVVCVDTYPGVRDAELLVALAQALQPRLLIDAARASKSPAEVSAMVDRELTTDRVFGLLSRRTVGEFLDPEASAAASHRLATAQGVVLVYGTGASLLCTPDVLVLADLARWEIQQRYRRKETPNWLAANTGEDVLRMYKRGFYLDWRVYDRHKKSLFPRLDYVLDTNRPGDPALLTGSAFREALARTAQRPFRVVPFFDPGVWGGQWMKSVCGLDPSLPNYAWCFDCVPEENSLVLGLGPVTVELPSIDLVFARPEDLLGPRVHARFGTEFPIRFDLLDTMGGGNLSLQVHPLTEYIQDHFNMPYTEDESYYLLDAGDDGSVFLGLKEGVNPAAMMADLRAAQAGGAPFPDEEHVNRFPARKHDHFLIPAGTVHCSGQGSLVLEISSTPFMFTFKMWDWGRLGMDGKPRPVHLDHAEANIQWDRTTDWVKRELVNRIEVVAQGDGWTEERTGLHERQFLETRRHWFTAPVDHHTGGGVNVLNLVEGEAAVVESPTGAFAPFEVHYAETFLVPAAVGAYRIRPLGEAKNGRWGTVKAFVRA
ncbi:MAG: class I mannose-6-phosphate isomerase [Spirochaetales bacterium]